MYEYVVTFVVVNVYKQVLFPSYTLSQVVLLQMIITVTGVVTLLCDIGVTLMSHYTLKTIQLTYSM